MPFSCLLLALLFSYLLLALTYIEESRKAKRAQGEKMEQLAETNGVTGKNNGKTDRKQVAKLSSVRDGPNTKLHHDPTHGGLAISGEIAKINDAEVERNNEGEKDVAGKGHSSESPGSLGLELKN